MNPDHSDDIVPEQETGAKTDAEHIVIAPGLKEARELFELAKERLKNINTWHILCGKGSAIFTLTDSRGIEVNRKAGIGDYIRINIPGPGSQAGEGYDWVRIEEIEESTGQSSGDEANSGIFGIRVRPAQDPRMPGEPVAHFFKDSATSTFAVEIKGTTITASVHGRNEIPNTDTENLFDKVRNAVIALGAMVGLSIPQWKCLVKGLLEPPGT